jgi:hypothetical protein
MWRVTVWGAQDKAQRVRALVSGKSKTRGGW